MNSKNAGNEAKIKICHCLRCGHEWASRQEKPIICARCKSPYWDKERKNKKDIS